MDEKDFKVSQRAHVFSIAQVFILLIIVMVLALPLEIKNGDLQKDINYAGTRTANSTATFDIPVHLGYNLISVPLVQSNTSIVAVLDDDGGDTSWDYALWYDASDTADNWKTYATFKPAILNDLNEVDHTMGIILNIIDVGSDGFLTVRGELPTVTIIPLYEGMNLVGYPALNESMTVADVKASTGNRVTSIKNRTEVPYLDDYVLKRGEGYWLNVSENCTWTTPDETTTFDIPVQPGYNLISVPLVQANTSIYAVLDDCGGDTIWDYALWFNISDSTDPWKTHGTFRPAPVNDLNEVDHTMGIILNITDVGSDGNLTVRGTLPTTTTIPLYVGRNLVGYPALNESMTVADVKAMTVYRVKSVNNRSEIPYPDDYLLKRGEGYWFNVSENCTWTVNEVIPQNPVSIAAPDFQNVSVGENASFDGGQSFDPDGIIMSYLWDFGDGNNGTGISVMHVYATPGNFTITLTVTDNDGLTGNDTCTVDVKDVKAPTIFDIIVTPSIPTNRQTITVTCNVTDDVEVAYVNLMFFENGTAWVTVPMVNEGTSVHRATFGPVNQNTTFHINVSDTNENLASRSENLIVRKALIEATSEGLDSSQDLKTGSTVLITGTVYVDGKVDSIGLYVIAFFNGEELGRCQVQNDGSYLLEFVLPDFEEGDTLEILLVDYIGGDMLQLESLILPGRHPFPWLPVIFGSVIGVSALLALATEVGKYALLLLIIPLYSKLKKDEVLNLYTRGKIHGYILANPGEHYNAIKRALKINNGSLAYHLHVLEKEEIIKSKASGMYKRFYPRDMAVPNGGFGELTQVQSMVLDKIKETPGISQKDVAKLLGIAPSTVNYHINKLLELDAVRTERKGKWAKYYANPVPEDEQAAK